MKIALCVIAKNEILYIREFVKYYFNLGVNHIYIYDNNPVDGECLFSVLSEYIIEDRITIYNVRGVDKEKKITHQNTQLSLHQFICQDCYNRNKEYYDWFLFFDVDEFLYTENKTIQEYLNQEKFKEASVIKVNWKNYNDNGTLYYTSDNIFTRFSKEAPNVKWRRGNNQTKCIVRGGGFNIVNYDVHNFKLNWGNVVDSVGNISLYRTQIPNYEEAYIKHYVTKTISEYLPRYFNRTFSGKRNRKYKIEDVENNFFSINERTIQKDAIIKKFLEQI